jgi:hypothetical protein
MNIYFHSDMGISATKVVKNSLRFIFFLYKISITKLDKKITKTIIPPSFLLRLNIEKKINRHKYNNNFDASSLESIIL